MRSSGTSDALSRFLSKVALRSKLTDAERDAVLGLRPVPREIGVHYDVVGMGKQVDYACLVADGYIARFVQLEDGARQNISIYIAGDIAGLSALLLPARFASLVALAPTTILQIPYAALRDLASQHAGIAEAFCRECAIEANIVAQWLVSVGRKDARGRLAHLLCEMAVRSHHAGIGADGRFPFPLTQEQIADTLGLTPVHVNRVLQALRREGFVQLSNREVAICDWCGLTATAEFDAAYLHMPSLPTASRQALAS